MTRIKILSQNIFWFQGVPFESDQPGDANSSVINKLVEIYQPLDIQLFCFQEIQSQKTVDSLIKALTFKGVYTSGNQMSQYGGSALSQFHLKPIQTQEFKFDRLCQLFTFSHNETHLKVANVHLPSNRHLGPEGSRKKKLEEMGSLLSAHQDIDIVCGDFNDYHDSEIYCFMMESGFTDSAKFFNMDDQSTSISEKFKRGDFIWIKSNLEKNMKHYEVIPKNNLVPVGINKEYLSDHLPVILTMEF